jgi:anaerobic dimethyl sulfoxide reductase subunit A
VGVQGGWASGLGLQAPDGGLPWTVFPTGENPVRAEIPVFLWTEACLHGRRMTAADGVRGVDQLDNDIKLIYAVASNCLINQHADINRTVEILRDESKVEFITVQDNFLTPSARFADIVLPACTQFETWGVEVGWKYGDEVILQPKLVEPLGQSRSDYRICADLAERLGFGEAFTEGKDEKAWVKYCLDEFRRLNFHELPSLEDFIQQNLGVWTRPATHPAIAFADFRRDPEKYPLNTPSGKIEIFSRQLYDINRPVEVPAVPKYIQEWESPFGDGNNQINRDTSPRHYPLDDFSMHGADAAVKHSPGEQHATIPMDDSKLTKEQLSLNRTYPLQAIGHHTLHRVHSTHDNNDWLEEAFPQRVFINPLDASAREINDGDEVKVFNDRGALVLPCRITLRIMPGVVDIPQGAWYSPDQDGVDFGGNINVLTSQRWTPFAFGTTQHTIMVEVEGQNHLKANKITRIRPWLTHGNHS